VEQQRAAHAREIPSFTFGFSLVLLFAYPTHPVHATVPITPSGLHTVVTLSASPPAGHTQYDITGGTRPGGGLNLYHSFGNFNVPNNNIANFLNSGSIDLNGVLLPPNLPTANILGRINGGNPSSIFGMIQTNGPGGFPNANLFLMNPNGFLFGPTATINVGGMVSFTTADYLRLADGAVFNAMPNAAADALLSAAPVAAFGFLGPNPGAITVQGSQLTVANGTGISLVGGNLTIQSGTPDGGIAQPARLSAPNGKIQLASAASPGEFDAATLQPLPNVNHTSFTSFGSVSLAPGSNINVSGEQTVSIRGGQFVISVNDAVLSTASSPGPPQTISLSADSSIISSTSGADAGADVQLIASKVQMDGASIQSLTTGDGAGGNISITGAGGPNSNTAGSVQIKGGQIQSASVGPGKVGDIQINSGSLSMTDGALIDSLLVPNPVIPGQPGGGKIAITATDSVFVTGQRPGTQPTNLLPSVPGLPTLPPNTPSGIYSENVSANTGSRIVIQTPSLTLQSGLITSRAFGAGAAGDLSLLLGQLTLTDGGAIGSSTFGAGATGSLQLRASDSITMSGSLPETFQLGSVVLQNVASNITNVSFGLGQAGPVFVSTPILTMNGANIASSTLGSGAAGDVNIQAATISLTGGASISSSTFGSGPGGSISVTGSEQLSISGHRGDSTSFGAETSMNSPSVIAATTFGIGRAGALTVSTPRLTMFDGGLISTATGSDGPAGSVTVNAGSMSLSSGASISSSSGLNVGLAGGFLSGNGAGGTVTVNATGPVTMADQGSGLFTTTVGNGAGGNINLRGSSIQLSNGAAVSATSSGRGNAGNITVNAGNQFTMTNSAVTTEATQSSGGKITITTNPTGTMQLTNSTISASVLDGTGGGGSVNIDPQYVVLENSQILAQAVQGPGGNISITTNLLLPDSTSVISASSQFGQNGTVAIQSPIAPASGKIIPLSQKPLIETSLMSQTCAARAGGMFSTFTLAGRDTLPAEPDGWLSNPLALSTAELMGSTATEQSLSESAAETPLLSLRRIAPSGFLTQTFATDSGCTS
jgi:filamentous hemagglutinin family protein